MNKSVRPKQTAPVQRENTTTTKGQNYAATVQGIQGGVQASFGMFSYGSEPFAGDDAE